MTVGAAWQAPYELYAHCAVGRHVGLSDDEVRTLAEGGLPQDLSDTEAVAHRVARALSLEHRLDDALYREAEKLLGAKGIMDAVTAVCELMRIDWSTVGAIVARVWADTEKRVDRFANLRRSVSMRSPTSATQYLTVVVDRDSGGWCGRAGPRHRRPAMVVQRAKPREV